ncbi:MFS transporter [Cohnella nanjingensis]|uniref:MFS transporter n=1 Tax=Cohnella nanjingensis TaxID=1387779 RepID=A0A7X0VCT6_9BACL|nr:MFS transporter [Cohnella nanjingensis]MBB6669262.1 MFS transporter [Cohnella nanjingensis]
MKSQRGFGYLWAAQSLALFGDAFYVIALVTLVYRETGTATLTALVPIARVGALLVSGILAPLAIRRYPLVRILRFAQGTQTLFLVLMTIYCALSSGKVSLGMLFLFIALASLAEGCVAPARNSLLPRLVPEDRLVKANGYLSATDQSAQFVGWAIGGTLAATMGSANVLWLSAGLFTLLLAAVFGIREKDSSIPHDRAAEAEASKWQTIREGWVVIWRSRLLRTVTFTEVVEGVAGGVWAGALMLVFVQEQLHLGEEWWGFLNASYLIGAIAGGLIALSLSRRIDRALGAFAIGGAFIFGALTLAYAFAQVPGYALAISLLLGPPYQMKDIAKRTLFQKNVDAALLPKVFSAHGTVLYATFGISVFVMSAVSDLLGIQAAYLVSARLFLASTAFASLNWKAYRTTELRSDRSA